MEKFFVKSYKRSNGTKVKGYFKSKQDLKEDYGDAELYSHFERISQSLAEGNYVDKQRKLAEFFNVVKPKQ